MKALILLGFLLVPAFCQAQQAHATPDTVRWRDTSAKARHGLTAVRTTSGSTAQAYFPVDCVGFQDQIGYFRSNPEVRPFPKMQYIPTEKLQSVTIRGHYHESMAAAGRSDIVALRAVDGPVELFVLSGSAADNVPLLTMVPVLNLLAATATLGGSAIDRNRWFIRRSPGPLEPVTRAHFRQQLGTLTADHTELSAHITTETEGYRYPDLINIVTIYNSFLAKSPAPAPTR